MNLNALAIELKPTPAKLSLAGLISLGWALMIAHPMYLMVHHQAGMSWAPADFLKALTMWGLMVLAMMVPTLLPMFKSGESPPLGLSATLRFTLGYIVAWVGFCVAATALQYGLRAWALLDMHDSSVSAWLSATLLVGAGLFQLTNIKQAHLKACQLSLKRLRQSSPSESGYAVTGLNYGTDCIKCCWPMMLTMFVFGLMNIYTMAVLTVIMIAEKVVRNTVLFAKITGGLFIATGLLVLVV